MDQFRQLQPIRRLTALAGSEAAARLLAFVLLLALVRLLTLGSYPLMDTTEARYAEISRVMVERNDWITPWNDATTPFWGKPPLAFWVTALSLRLFGINEFAARLPHWFMGLAIAWLIWSLGGRRSRREGVIALALLWGSLMFLASAGSVMTDMALSLAVTISMRAFWLTAYGEEKERRRERWLFFVGLALGLLAKGPIALVLVLLPTGLWTIQSGQTGLILPRFPWLRGLLLTLLIALPWYLLAEQRTPGFLDYFLLGEHWHRFVTPGWDGDRYGVAHKYPRGTIWLFLLVDVLPWSLLLPPMVLLTRRGRRAMKESFAFDPPWRSYLLFWGLAPAVFFSFAGNILWPYVLPGIPGLALLGASWLDRWPTRARIDRLLMGAIAFMLLLTLAFPFVCHRAAIATNNSAKAAVEAYLSLRRQGEAILFIKRPYSALFYSLGSAEQVGDAEELQRRLDGSSRDFIVLQRRQIDALPPALSGRIEMIRSFGRYTLFAEKERSKHALP